LELQHLGDAQGMEYMVHVKLIHVLAANHIDFGIPVLIDGFQLLKLLYLLGGKVRKVGGN
jgi:hypothetical protein